MYNPSFEDLDYVGRCAVKMATKAHGAPPQWAEDAYQQAVVEALEGVRGFDPTRAGWNTWSYFKAKDGYLRAACVSDLAVTMPYQTFKLKNRRAICSIPIENCDDVPDCDCEFEDVSPRHMSAVKKMLACSLGDNCRSSKMVIAQFGIGQDVVKMADMCRMFGVTATTIRAAIKNKLACLRAELERQGFKKIDFCS